MKDIEWLKEEMSSMYPSYNEIYMSPDYETVVKVQIIDEVLELIDQLDEPEQAEQSPTQSMIEQVLEVFFTVVTELDERESPLTFKEFVYQSLEKLDEPDKPVIPQFVADWIEEKLPRGSIGTNTIEDKIYIISRFGYGNGLNTDTLYQGRDYEFNNKLNRDLVKYVSNNKVKVIRALINGYEVEKEKLYRVVLPFTVWDEYASELNETTMFLAFNITSGETRFSMSAGKSGYYRTDFTESQIKTIDKRYWAFAEEVTE